MKQPQLCASEAAWAEYDREAGKKTTDLTPGASRSGRHLLEQ